MNEAVCQKSTFPKSARLVKSVDFRFRPFSKLRGQFLNFYFTQRGNGRVGISISKKVLRRSVARNRVRRLIREAFRQDRRRFQGVDVHVVGTEALKGQWKGLGLLDVRSELERLVNSLSRPSELRP